MVFIFPKLIVYFKKQLTADKLGKSYLCHQNQYIEVFALLTKTPALLLNRILL
jgi:hypothetical protein